MGSIHGIVCECGYKSLITVGGDRETYLEDSKFPFYCKDCGVVSINVHSKKIQCPDCLSTEVKPYGNPEISVRLQTEEYPIIECGGYLGYRNGNLCPKCKEFTLCFGPSEIRFD